MDSDLGSDSDSDSDVFSDLNVDMDVDVDDGRLSVRDVLGLDLVATWGAEVVAGRSRLDRPVRWLHVAEAPDVAVMLTGGEMVLTTGLLLAADERAQVEYVESMRRADAAAVVLGLGRAFSSTPEAMRRAAERCGVPLIVLHRPAPFARLTEEVHARLLHGRFAALDLSDRMSTALARLNLAGVGVQRLLEEVASYSGCPAVVVNLAHRVLAAAGDRAALADLLRDWDRVSRQVAGLLTGDPARAGGPGGPSRPAERPVVERPVVERPVSDRQAADRQAAGSEAIRGRVVAEPMAGGPVAFGPDGWVVARLEARGRQWGSLVLFGPTGTAETARVLGQRAAEALALHRLLGDAEVGPGHGTAQGPTQGWARGRAQGRAQGWGHGSVPAPGLGRHPAPNPTPNHGSSLGPNFGSSLGSSLGLNPSGIPGWSPGWSHGWEEQAAEALLTDLAAGTARPEELLPRLRAAGLPTGRCTFVPLVFRQLGAVDGLREVIESVLTEESRCGLVARIGPTATAALVSVPRDLDAEAEIRRLATGVHERLAARGSAAAAVGAGFGCRALDELPRSFAEAVHVADAAVAEAPGTRPAGPVARVRDVRLRGLVRLLRDEPELQAFIERELGPLLARPDLLGVLRTYLRTGRNKSLTAQQHHVSRPALYRRLQSIEELTGSDLDDLEQLASLHVALLAHDAQTAPGG